MVINHLLTGLQKKPNRSAKKNIRRRPSKKTTIIVQSHLLRKQLYFCESKDPLTPGKYVLYKDHHFLGMEIWHDGTYIVRPTCRTHVGNIRTPHWAAMLWTSPPSWMRCIQATCQKSSSFVPGSCWVLRVWRFGMVEVFGESGPRGPLREPSSWKEHPPFQYVRMIVPPSIFAPSKIPAPEGAAHLASLRLFWICSLVIVPWLAGLLCISGDNLTFVFVQ